MQKIIIHLLTSILYIFPLEEIFTEKFSSFMYCLHLKLSNLYDYINSFFYIKKVKDNHLIKKTYD